MGEGTLYLVVALMSLCLVLGGYVAYLWRRERAARQSLKDAVRLHTSSEE